VIQTTETFDSVRIDFLPTPDEIQAECQQIRGSWSLNERRRRFVGPHLPDEPAPAWQPPTIDTSAFRLAMGPHSEAS